MLLLKRGQRRLGAVAPKPDAVGRVEPAGAARPVDRMILQDIHRTLHQLQKPPGRLADGQVPGHRAVGNVVRRGKGKARGCIFPNQAVPVADPGIEVELLVVEGLAQRADQLGRFLGRDLAGAVVGHDLIFVGALAG